MIDRKYPIGPIAFQEYYSKNEMDGIISTIETIPSAYRSRVECLSHKDLKRTYREGSWNVRQLVHHVADIQTLHYFRLKKALTEPDGSDTTLIDMNAWSATEDSLTAPVADSLAILDGIHSRYAFLARTLTEEQLAIKYFHPLRKIWFNQKQALYLSAWHAQHHLAHIGLALEETF